MAKTRRRSLHWGHRREIEKYGTFIMKVIYVTTEETGKSEWLGLQGITYEKTLIFSFPYTLSSVPLILPTPDDKSD